MIVEQGPQDALFPFPLGIFFLRVDKLEEFKAVVDSFMQAYDLPLKEDNMVLPGSATGAGDLRTACSPSTVSGRTTFFGNSTMLLRRVIDAHASKVSLADIAAVEISTRGLPGRTTR